MKGCPAELVFSIRLLVRMADLYPMKKEVVIQFVLQHLAA